MTFLSLDGSQPYYSLLLNLKNYGKREVNRRTGVEILMLEGGYSFKIDLDNGRLPMPGNRRYFPHVAAAETAWQFMGTKEPEFILRHAPKLWSKFVRNGELETAYGYRWREHFGRDQLQQAVHELGCNPTNRQLYVSAWDPSSDGLGGAQPPNVPCPVGFSLTTSGERLHVSVFLRSSDVFVGLPYDVMCYALTMDAICTEIGKRPGTLHFTLAHAHVYEPHFEYLDDAVRGEYTNQWPKAEDIEPELPGLSVAEILADPEGYIDRVKKLGLKVKHPEFNPRPEVVV